MAPLSPNIEPVSKTLCRDDLPWIFDKINKIIANHNKTGETINLVYNYNSGFTIVGTDNTPLDTTVRTGPGLAIVEDIHRNIGPQIIINLAADESAYQRSFGSESQSYWSSTEVKEYLNSDSGDIGLFLMEDHPISR